MKRVPNIGLAASYLGRFRSGVYITADGRFRIRRVDGPRSGWIVDRLPGGGLVGRFAMDDLRQLVFGTRREALDALTFLLTVERAMFIFPRARTALADALELDE